MLSLLLVLCKHFFYAVLMATQVKTGKSAMRSLCPLANALDIMGDRWTLLIIRDLMFTSRCEFGQLLNAGEGIATNILAERLERLQQHGIISKQKHPEHGKKYRYALTELGLKLAPVLIETVLWGSEAVKESSGPPHIMSMMKRDKDALLQKIYRREPLFEWEQ